MNEVNSKIQQLLTTGIVLSICLVSACNSTKVVIANSEPAIQSSHTLDPDLILDIGITPLDPNLPETEEALREALIPPEVKRAEALYIAYHLKDTLEKTGNWGAVRVVPSASATVDISVSGKILNSDGELLELDMVARDSTGRIWIDKTYSDQSSKFSYDLIREDPFQDFYNEFANDLLKAREVLKAASVKEIKNVSSVLYASQLSPYAYGDYLEESGGKRRIKQLPSREDPMIARIERIKDKDYLFIDTLDEFYGKFYRDMYAPYHDWRQYTYEEAIELRRIQKDAGNKFLAGTALVLGGLVTGSKAENWAQGAAAAGAVTGGIGALVSGMNRKKDAEIHADSLREISRSLAGEITPLVFEVEGHTVELQGSVDGQYEKWQKILRQIYAEETGLPVD
ncbi:MAG: hypothetical protein OEZ23_05670 [Gammaproteobacteria bacterium]|nr:hypothetical protein [Gammaproteobacteria bacterium]